ncbi:choline/ethanolamine kinase isoform X2 [Coccinella septempunctata]|uniref:choline/ethanolamine kinase isoform X2 n=1 Tax=Coccinella septempunctata TaxID=41139 RepID=UPI001D07AB3A|nr:choline/ethanolamine kinase isoform X2 [Coccinella septempunctata]
MASVLSNVKMCGDTAEMRELATRICKDYLNGAWKAVNASNIGFKHISGGLSNLLYHISLPESLQEKIQDEPKEVLLRVYGQTHGEGAIEAIITESVIFTLLSERGLGPKLHGIFPGGRIEQYINARPLKNKELAIEKLSSMIAQKMARIHSMEVPLDKEPSWLWNTMERWLGSCMTPAKEEKFAARLPNIDLRTELDWLRDRIEREGTEVVFCHNDMQEGNILMQQGEDCDPDDPKLVLIDFEYCSYNYRAFDLANHFVEWIYDYTHKEYPFFSIDEDNYPSEKQRLRFIEEYLAERNLDENPKKLLREVEIFTLASHLLWTLWAFVNDETSQIPFGYWEYGTARLSSYIKLKNQLTTRPTTKRKLVVLEKALQPKQQVTKGP